MSKSLRISEAFESLLAVPEYCSRKRIERRAAIAGQIRWTQWWSQL
ncbi:MAG: hypothetical protein IH933_06950 [Euryarchaeota archaeon]|nr:hypothetical protein [Euryarchaeota archaeon]